MEHFCNWKIVFSDFMTVIGAKSVPSIDEWIDFFQNAEKRPQKRHK